MTETAKAFGETVPAFMVDVLMDMMHNQVQKVMDSHRDTFERMKHHEVENAATLIQVLEGLIDILHHPNGGIAAAEKCIRAQIEIVKNWARDVDKDEADDEASV